MRSAAWLWLCIGLGILLVLVVFAQRAWESRAIEFFQSSLHDAFAVEDVAIGNSRYRVNRGSIADAPLSRRESFEILRLAYAMALVRRDPILDIEGTELDELERSVQKLTQATQLLADAQTSPEDAGRIVHLYPIDFLQSLVSLEASRKRLLTEGSDTHLDEYTHTLHRTITAGKNDLTAFRSAFNEVVNHDIARTPTLGGMISVEAMRSALQDIEVRFDEYASLQSARSVCVMGYVSACDPAEIALEIEVSPDSEPMHGPPIDETRSILRSATGYIGKEEIVLLEESRCLSELPGPYAFWIRSDTHSPIDHARFLNDLYFIPTIPNAKSVLGYLASMGISYSPVNPTAFYNCPAVESDFAALTATRATYDLAASKPGLTELDLKPYDGVYSERAARAYLFEALRLMEQRRDIPVETLHAVESAILTFDGTGGAGLNALVAQVARIQAEDVRLKEQGVPFDLSARTQFLTHSAFPSFFLAAREKENGSLSSSVSDEDALSLFFTRYVRYSDIRSQVPREKIENDIRAFITFEKKGQATSP